MLRKKESYIEEILESIVAIESFVKDMTLDKHKRWQN